MPVSVVIPTLNEETRIGESVASAFAAGAAEVIVADGGSSDRTVAIAKSNGARVIEGERLRARQLNCGARAAAHESIVFLHADTLLPDGAANAIETTLAAGATFGGFRVRFSEPGWRLRYVAFMINARTSLTRAPWGDQAQFVRRKPFLDSGGYREMPLMEDYDLARRMKRFGRTAVLSLEVTTSGRRFLEKGVIRTSILNWMIITAWHLGIAPERLARWYRGQSGPGAGG